MCGKPNKSYYIHILNKTEQNGYENFINIKRNR